MNIRNLVISVFLMWSTCSIAQTGWFLITDSIPIHGSTQLVFTSDDTGYVYSGEYTLAPYFLKTTNGGKTWFDLKVPFSSYPNSLQFIEPNIGYFIDGTSVMRTIDAGKTWDRFPLKDSVGYYDLQFLTPSLGFVCGVDGYHSGKGVLFSTSDSGKTWHEIVTVSNISSGYYYKVNFLDTLNGYILLHEYWPDSYIEMLTTNDGGKHLERRKKIYPYDLYFQKKSGTWLSLDYYHDPVNSLVVLKDDSVFKEIPVFETDLTERDTLYSMKYFDDNIGFVGTYNHRIYKTIDGGETWFRQNSPNEFAPESFSLPSATVGYFISGQGIYKTIDGGGGPASIRQIKQKEFGLTPNPASQYLIIENDSIFSERLVVVYDALGRNMQSSEIPAMTTSYRLDISHLASGTYLVKAGSRIMRFVKE
jgi:photosystem II stability/assembly factor-like uncharacterized protein